MMQENTLQEVATSLQPSRKGGAQVSRDGWRLTQIVEGEIDYGKVLKWWRLGEKGLTRLPETVTFRQTDEGKLLTPDAQRP